jgi:CelD/BcsL family acetyltransferase involved in cellulose biosynthesis
MWKLLHPKGMLVLHLIEYREKVIAGMLVLTFNKIAISEHAASDSRYLKHSPNQLLWWKAIEHSHQEKYVYFDMGKSYENTGLIDFKRRWQPREYNIYHLFFPEVTGVYSSNSESHKRRVVNTVLRHLPLPLARMGGYYLYRHMG